MRNYLLRKFKSERLLYSILLGFFVVAIALSLVKDLYFITSSEAVHITQKGEAILHHLLSNIIVLAIQMIFIVMSTKYFLRKSVRPAIIVTSHLFLSILSGVFSYWLVLLLSVFTGVLEYEVLSTFNHIDRVFTTVDVNFVIYFAILSVVFLYHYFKKNQETQLEKKDVENRLISANLNLLKSQLEPHFLFNSLNTVSSLVHTDQDKAVETLSDLGDVLRDILMLRETQFITICQELEYLEKFVKLLQVRFENQIKFDTILSQDSKQIKVPALILQPILENAIKHGLKGDIEFIEIIVHSKTLNGYLEIAVKNSGNRIISSKNDIYSLKKGIELTKERLELAYSKNFTFDLKNIKDKPYNVGVFIRIPVLTY